VDINAELRLTDGTHLQAAVALQDAVSTIALKTRARAVRIEARD
jgi:hypothetical protein